MSNLPPAWREAAAEAAADERAMHEVSARDEQLNADLGLPSFAPCLDPTQHHALALTYAQKTLKASGEADPRGTKAREMARHVMEARAAKTELLAAHTMGGYAFHSRMNGVPSKPFERPSIHDHYRVTHAKRGAAWQAADDEMRRTPPR